MRAGLVENIEAMGAKLAMATGVFPEEIIFTRNPTESVFRSIGGLDGKAGDEAVMAEQDYGAMRDMFTQVSKRYGVINKVVSVPNHPESDEEIVNLSGMKSA